MEEVATEEMFPVVVAVLDRVLVLVLLAFAVHLLHYHPRCDDPLASSFWAQFLTWFPESTGNARKRNFQSNCTCKRWERSRRCGGKKARSGETMRREMLAAALVRRAAAQRLFDFRMALSCEVKDFS